MSFSPRKKQHSKAPSTSAPATGSGFASSQVTQQLQFPTNSQSHSQSPQEKQQSQPVYPWSARAPLFGQSPSPLLRHAHTLSTSAAAAGEMFLFGGYVHKFGSSTNDLYVFSTRDFSIFPFQTSGNVPDPRFKHCAVLTGTTLLSNDDSFYLLNLVSREWSRIVVDGPGPGGRYSHTMTLVGSKLFVFGGRTASRRFNDMWALDLNSLKSNPFWESSDPAPGNEKPLPRAGHVSVTTDDRIIIFGGCSDRGDFNDTWSFNISTRKWTELQCTGSVPSPRSSHAAVLVDDVMYVFGGVALDRTKLGGLTVLNLSTQRWTVFQNIGPSPSRRWAHAMAADGTRIFVVGGVISEGTRDEFKLIHVLDTKLLNYPELDTGAVDASETTSPLTRKSSVGLQTKGQPQQPSPPSDTHAAHGVSPFQKATPEELDHPTSQQITREQYPCLDGLPSRLPSRLTGASGRPRRVPEDDDGGESSTEHHANLVALGAPSGNEIARLEDGRVIELEQQLSGTLVAKTDRDQRIAQLTDELALKSALLEQAEENAAEAKKRAGLEQRELQAKLGELLLSRDQALEQAQSALQKATFRATEADERSQRELVEVHVKLEARESELAAVRLRLTDAEDGWANSKAEADTLRAQTATGSVNNTNEDQVACRLMERMRAIEAEMASRRWNEKSIAEMECRNEG